MTQAQWRWLAGLAATALALIALVAAYAPRGGVTAPPPRATVPVTILAINDFHGNLKPPRGGISIIDHADRTKRIAVPAGGAEHMATLIKQLRSKARHSVFVAAGDLIGASPFLSAQFHDEPTVEALSLMGLEITAVGNHEFDDGKHELLRIQNGGCHPLDGCQGPSEFKGAWFRYLAASTFDRSTGKTLLPAYEVKEFDGIPVAFIGLTLKNTPNVVSPSGVAGLEFRDEAQTINALVPELRQRGIEAIVVLIHEGGFPVPDGECPISGAIDGIVRKLDKAVDLIVSGHTHRAYTCIVDGRLVTSADKYGTLVTEIEIELDRKTRDLVSARANNVLVRTDTLAKDPEQTALIGAYEARIRPLAERKVGSITASLSREEDPAGESVLGQIIADAQLAATGPEHVDGAVIAFTHPGGIRNDMPRSPDGTVTYADLFAVQPFGNVLVTLTFTGAQIKTLLEQQWLDQPRPRILKVSRGFSYTWDDRRPAGNFVDGASIMLNGKPIDPGGRYRVTVNGFLADGGDNFAILREGTEPRTGVTELAALEAYFKAHDPVSPGKLDRIHRVQ